MIPLTLKIVADDSLIQGLYQLFLYQLKGDRPTKKAFIDYMKSQIAAYGTDETQFSNTDGYDDLTPDDLNQLMKWGLI